MQVRLGLLASGAVGVAVCCSSRSRVPSARQRVVTLRRGRLQLFTQSLRSVQPLSARARMLSASRSAFSRLVEMRLATNAADNVGQAQPMARAACTPSAWSRISSYRFPNLGIVHRPALRLGPPPARASTAAESRDAPFSLRTTLIDLEKRAQIPRSERACLCRSARPDTSAALRLRPIGSSRKSQAQVLNSRDVSMCSCLLLRAVHASSE